MASYYVWSGATGSGTGASWANAFTALQTAMSGRAAGDIFYVSSDHAQTAGAAVTVASPGTVGNPCFVYSVNRAGSVPPVSADLLTGGSITTTGNFALSLSGSFTMVGVTLSGGSGAVNAKLNLNSGASARQVYRNCALIKAGTTGIASAISFGSGASTTTELINTTVQFGSTGDSFGATSTGVLFWLDTADGIAGATIPTTLLQQSSSGQDVFIHNVGFQDISGTLIAAGAFPNQILFDKCRLHASATVGTPTIPGAAYHLINCDSGATNYRHERYNYFGVQTVETTIVRASGATDGTTPIAWKIVTTANSKWEAAFASLPISIWNNTTGSAITLTVYGVWGGGAVPNNDNIWIEAEYLGSASYPIGSTVTSTKANNIASGSALTSDSSTWGGSTTKFKMAVTFTPQMKGPVTVTVKAALASSTFYIDPKPEISGVTVSRSAILSPGVYVNELSNATVAGSHLNDGLHAIGTGIYEGHGLYDSASEAIFAAFTTSPTTARKTLIDALVVALKAAGVWTKLDALYIEAAADSQAAKINWKAPGSYNLTEVNAPTFTADRGFTGASTKYLDTGFNPTTAGSPKYVRNDATIFAWSLTNVDVNGGIYGTAGLGTGGETFLVARLSGSLYQSINGFDGASFSSTDSSGLWAHVRTGASATILYRNATSFQTTSFASEAIYNGNLYFLNRGGTYFTGQIMAGGIASQLSGAEMTALYNALNDYKTGVGA